MVSIQLESRWHQYVRRLNLARDWHPEAVVSLIIFVFAFPIHRRSGHYHKRNVKFIRRGTVEGMSPPTALEETEPYSTLVFATASSMIGTVVDRYIRRSSNGWLKVSLPVKLQ
jgi:hypothetical protein